GAIEAVFRSWNGARAVAYRVRERIPHDLGTAVNVQTMVFGNRDDNSGTGVGFTRDPATGKQGAYGDFLVNAQGEDVVPGIRNTLPLPELEKRFPKIYKEHIAIFARLEKHYRDMCDTEFTIEQGKLVRTEGSPEYGHGLSVAEGILTSRGGLVSHAAVVARGWGKPAVVGAEKSRIKGKSFSIDRATINEGDTLTINGTTGEVVE